MGERLKRAEGSSFGGSCIEVFSDKLVIKSMLHAEEIRLSDITSVMLTKTQSGSSFNGKLDVFVSGRSTPKSSVQFNKKHEREFDEVKNLVDQLLIKSGMNFATGQEQMFSGNINNTVSQLLRDLNITSGQVNKSVVFVDGQNMSNVDFPGIKNLMEIKELERWAALRDKGIITEEEFNFKKKQLLYNTNTGDGTLKMIKCKYCGTQHVPGEEKCSSCGAPLS
ncbi:MAG TPA: SHOCT domain-containing protein [Methanocella sp.]|nr:SHOCT domain-containing protein [Methanocella sp.]